MGMNTSDLPHTPHSLRALRRLTKVQLAEKAGVTDRTIRQLEAGEDVSLETLRSVARALEVTFEVLVAAHDVARSRKGAA